MPDLPIVAPGYAEEIESAPEDEALSGCLMNTCVIDKAVLTESMRAAMRRPFFRALRTVELIVIAAALGLVIWSVAAKQDTSTLLQALFLLAAALFFFVQQFLLYPRRAVKNQLLRQATDEGTVALENRLWFTPENVANRRGDSEELRHMDYGKIKRVSETRRLILLTTRRNRVIPLDKKGFSNGDSGELYKLLALKAPKAKIERRHDNA